MASEWDQFKLVTTDRQAGVPGVSNTSSTALTRYTPEQQALILQDIQKLAPGTNYDIANQGLVHSFTKPGASTSTSSEWDQFKLAENPAPPPSSMVSDALLGIGDIKRGSRNVLNRTLRGVSGGYLGSPEVIVKEGKQAGDYVGEIGTDIALAAAPMSGAAKLANILRKAPVVGKVAPVATNIAANAGYSAATTDQDRGRAALWGAGGSTAGTVASRVLPSIVPRAGGEALERLKQAGITPTPGQAAQTRATLGNDMLTYGENLLEKVPLAGFGVKRAKEYNTRNLAEALGDPKLVKELAELTKPGPYVAGNLAKKQVLEKALAQEKGLNEVIPNTTPGLRNKQLSAADIVRAEGEATGHGPGIGEGIGSGILGLSAFLNAPATALGAIVATMGYTKPMQTQILNLMRASDTVGEFLARNPTFAAQIGRTLSTQNAGRE